MVCRRKTVAHRPPKESVYMEKALDLLETRSGQRCCSRAHNLRYQTIKISAVSSALSLAVLANFIYCPIIHHKTQSECSRVAYVVSRALYAFSTVVATLGDGYTTKSSLHFLLNSIDKRSISNEVKHDPVPPPRLWKIRKPWRPSHGSAIFCMRLSFDDLRADRMMSASIIIVCIVLARYLLHGMT